MTKLNRKTIKTYTFVPEDDLKHEVFKIIIEQTLFESKGSIEIIDEELTPIDVRLVHKFNNNINGAISSLEDRAMQSNRMFLAEYCEKHGLNVDSLDDRLSISNGKVYEDNLSLVMTEEIIDV